ncbi:type II secretion system F family protein [Castellaniella sp.]|uniref:type II secretion system F family protein n=1 Tax=Castellaniella sp. TaxID=1955812 RepID=UPI002AFDEF37|nr:type II secretion system F family protein [Castellaniella sp.]
MSTADVITLAFFLLVILLGLAVLLALDVLRRRPRHQIRQRLESIRDRSGGSKNNQAVARDLSRARTESHRRRRRESLGSLGYYLNRLDTVTGSHGVRNFLSVLLVMGLAGVALVMSGVLPGGLWVAGMAVFGMPLLVGIWLYRFLLSRFNKKFLIQMPEAMDMIVRSSQAGIPITQALRQVGLQFKAPLGPEFLRIGNGLLLGEDLQDVLDKSVQRILLPDFTFFSVCVLLQRESGGSIAEALENLSGIIRARRDLQLKAKALTAEGRFSGRLLSAIPFVIVGVLYASNPKYIETLFLTKTGHTLLWVVGGMLIVGIFLIQKISDIKI